MTKRETARRDARTAGKTARQTGSAKRAWTNRRDRAGNPYAIDPDGRKWHGTPAEVRESALTPWRRDMLAESLHFIRFYANRHGTDREAVAGWARSKRLDAIQARTIGDVDATVTIPADVYIRLCAGARLLGLTNGEFFADLWETQISALLDVAQSDTGKREIPLTRHERSALDRLAARAKVEG